MIIRIQQDGPNAHIDGDDRLWDAGLQNLGLQNKILLYKQPANSPDLNINNLSFFWALEAKYQQYAPSNAGDIINTVQAVYNDYPINKINRIYLSLMGVMNKIIESHGNNDFEAPHMNKDQKERLNELPICLPVTDSALTYLELNASIV